MRNESALQCALKVTRFLSWGFGVVYGLAALVAAGALLEIQLSSDRMDWIEQNASGWLARSPEKYIAGVVLAGFLSCCLSVGMLLALRNKNWWMIFILWMCVLVVPFVGLDQIGMELLIWLSKCIAAIRNGP